MSRTTKYGGTSCATRQVDSSFVEAIGWVSTGGREGYLVVGLKGDDEDIAIPATSNMYAAMCRSKSKGKFFNSWLKGREDGERWS